jgi:sulfatase maturation enzyme AslB (radical SAM superfamily)
VSADTRGVAHHILFVPGMTDAIGRACAERILESPSPYVDVDFRGGEPLSNVNVVRRIVEQLRKGCLRTDRKLALSMVTNLSHMTSEACDWLLANEVMLTVTFDGPPEAHEANRVLTGAPAHEETQRWVREIHDRHEALGVPPSLAYVTGAVTVTRATVAAGADAVVEACRSLGLVYVLLQPLRSPGRIQQAYLALACAPDEYLAFYREALRRIVDLNDAGTLLVEKRLALYLETLSTIDPRSAPTAPSTVELLAYGHDGRVYSRGSGPLLASGGDQRGAIGRVETDHHRDLARRALDAVLTMPQSAGCATCHYDRYCGTSLIRRYTMDDDVVTKDFGTDWCKTSMGTFDHVFELLRSERGATLRRVSGRWMAARDGVAARLRAQG